MIMLNNYIKRLKEIKIMTDKEFCDMYNAYSAEQIDKPMQLTETFDGAMLKEFIEHCIEFNNVDLADVVGQSEQFICPCCGSDKTYKTKAYHCNRCAVTTEV